ncbi:MAG: D-2-hydroxyacid dehydrogenase [Clostridia bacterium]
MRILSTDGLDKDARAAIIDMGHELEETHFSPADLKLQIGKYHAVIVRSATKITRGILDGALETGLLKLVVRAGVGTDNIDVPYAEKNGISVANTPGASSGAVAEMALAHMLVLSRFLHLSNLTMREGRWEKKHYKGTEISGKTLGLVGSGRIALELSGKALALGMRVLYTNRSGQKKEFSSCKYVSFEELLRESDYVSLHVPDDKKAGPMITKRELCMMKKSAYLINTARGGLVDEEALLDALEHNNLAGAGIDVFAEEPTGNIALVNHPKVSASPHVGGATREAQHRIGQEIVEIIRNLEES